ncbi:MAG: ATP-dependent sacrificial sulfur transferase LarE [Verrucomicrobiota bacterium]
MDLDEKEIQLQRLLNTYPRLLIAYSGGVDSGFLLWFAAHRTLVQTTGILADSPSLKRSELREALEYAARHKLKVKTIQTEEMENPDYAANPLNRCYYCKYTLFDQMNQIAEKERFDALCYGENADDANHDRPGRQAARDLTILAPLQQIGLSKQEIRELAAKYQLEIADKVAQPCLASRIPHGIAVTPERLQQVEKAEAYLTESGFKVVRVRHHDRKAVVQVSPTETARLLQPETTKSVKDHLINIGFETVEIDPIGYQGAGLK